MPTLYECKSAYPLPDAQQNLAGRTHYVDADTLRYFRARVLSTHVSDNGLLFAILESCSGDYEHRTRIFRHVIFDVFGTVLSRPDAEFAHRSRGPAAKAMWRALEAIDAGAVTRAAIETRRASFARELADLATRVDAIEAEKQGSINRANAGIALLRAPI